MPRSTRPFLPHLTVLTVLTVVGCPKPGPGTTALTGPPPSEPHHGAWYGSGLAFPGERLCLVFCADGRMFAGDTTCDDVHHPKFQTVWTHTLAGDAVHAESSAAAIDFQWSQTGTHAVADIAGISNLPLDQQSRTSPLCGNAPMPDRPSRPAPAMPF